MSKEKINSILKDMDLLFENFYTWLSGQYDSKSGGFFYARSSRTDDEFKTDIESTGQAVHILENSELITTMPSTIKEELINFFRERQDPNTGYFYDAHNNMREVDRMVARAITYSTSILEILHSKPLYPIPGSKDEDTLPKYMKTPEIYLKWLEERDWSYSWMACDNISAAGVYLKAMPEAQKKIYLDVVLNFLNNKQDPETGMWGEGRPYIKISGAFKLALFYKSLEIPMPKVDKIYQYLLKTLREDTSEDMCWTRNPVDLLMSMEPQFGPYPEEDLEEIFQITYRNLKQYLKPDGGFSRHVKTSLKSPNEAVLGKGLVEGDMNASTQALRIRCYCYLLAGMKVPQLNEYIKDFYSNLK